MTHVALTRGHFSRYVVIFRHVIFFWHVVSSSLSVYTPLRAQRRARVRRKSLPVDQSVHAKRPGPREGAVQTLGSDLRPDHVMGKDTQGLLSRCQRYSRITPSPGLGRPILRLYGAQGSRVAALCQDFRGEPFKTEWPDLVILVTKLFTNPTVFGDKTYFIFSLNLLNLVTKLTKSGLSRWVALSCNAESPPLSPRTTSPWRPIWTSR